MHIIYLLQVNLVCFLIFTIASNAVENIGMHLGCVFFFLFAFVFLFRYSEELLLRSVVVLILLGNFKLFYIVNVRINIPHQQCVGVSFSSHLYREYKTLSYSKTFFIFLKAVTFYIQHVLYVDGINIYALMLVLQQMNFQQILITSSSLFFCVYFYQLQLQFIYYF